MSVLKRWYDSLFHTYERRDLSRWEHEPAAGLPIFGVYHIMMDTGWETLAAAQIRNLRDSGLLEATKTLYVSCITADETNVDRLKQMIGSSRVEIVSCLSDPKRYEYPALEFVKRLSAETDGLVYYFHSKGISYQSVSSTDQTFRAFRQKIDSWREMLEYFVFYKWRVVVNVLTQGYQSYGCYRWPPRKYTMYSGSFWWARLDYIRTLPDFDPQVIAANRFYSEIWLFEKEHRQFSAFDSIVDLYFVNIPRSIYADGKPRLWDVIRFSSTYNFRKMEKHLLHRNYKERCQKRFQKLKTEIG
jgi:hypothetical protein